MPREDGREGDVIVKKRARSLAEFLQLQTQRPGLLAANEPATWQDASGVIRQTVKIRSRLKFGKVPLHRHLRDFVMARDGRRCVLCGFVEFPPGTIRPLSEPLHLLEVDHIISRRNGGSHHPDNLQVLCNRCNSSKSNLIDSKRTAEGRA